ncbi:MAG: ABC transporter substrate-binding protein [Propionibacteriaceae bacterium]|nr:ABC transporter substrate-binding protein [Propionibacteriaceae bacterium]
MKQITRSLAVLAVALAATLSACSASPSSNTSGTPAANGSGSYVTDGTYTETMVSDPGSLDPQLSIVSGAFEMGGFAYDTIVGISPTGDVLPQLAKSWTDDGTSATFTLNDGITCSDGSTLTAQTVADNINWVENTDNASPFLGTFLPAGITASADNTTNIVTFDLSVPAPFLLQSIANLPIVCDAGLADRSQLTSATIGSGPYELTQAVPNDHYTYTRRDGYTWGPDGATTATQGMPKTITVQIVPNESTAVNLLLAGSVNMVTTTGPDGARAQAAGLSSINVPANLGYTWYNHADGHPTADANVRQALTQAINYDDLATAITGNTGSRATALAVLPPTTCSYDSVSGNVSPYDLQGVDTALQAAGYSKTTDNKFAKDGQPLTINFLYDSVLGTTGDAAAELATQDWQAAGITVNTQSMATAQMSAALFGTDTPWDVAWEPINVNSPDQMMAFFSGPGPADGGSNLSMIDNQTYNNAVADAMTKTGQDACTAFQQAEASLFTANDFIAWAVRVNPIYLSKVEYVYVGRTQPTGLRMLA